MFAFTYIFAGTAIAKRAAACAVESFCWHTAIGFYRLWRMGQQWLICANGIFIVSRLQDSVDRWERRSDACTRFDTQKLGRLMHDCSHMRTRNSPLPRQQNSSHPSRPTSLSRSIFLLCKNRAPVERTHRCAEIKKKEPKWKKKKEKKRSKNTPRQTEG